MFDMLPESYGLYTYISVFLGPFVQEDAAVLWAASLAANIPKQTPTLFVMIVVGLFFSDIWKYWIGWAALKNERARLFAEKKHVADLKTGVSNNLLLTLLSARFVPLARIPTYVACGYFNVPYPKYCLLIAFTAILYAIVIFTICRLFGAVMGEQMMWVMPIVAIGIVIIIATLYILKKRRHEL